MLTFEEIRQAQVRLQGGILKTPCYESEPLSRLTGCKIYCKAEYLQPTGSFKERGARNALLLLGREQAQLGVIAASAGNHALALAYHGRALDIPVTVVMPTFAPLIKQTRCRDLGAEVLLSGSNIAECKLLADQIASERGLSYIHGFDGREVMAGAGTLGLEILEQSPDVDAILVPIGGGGLIAGLSLAVKSVRPDVKVFGVEAENTRSFAAALQEGRPVRAEMRSTLADGLAVPEVGHNAFELARRYVDGLFFVNEESITLAILRLIEMEKGVVEGAGAAPLAALLPSSPESLKGSTLVLCLCGGNIDPMVLGRVIEHALTLDGRLARFRAFISDRPGGLAHFCEVIAKTGASVKQILHERAFTTADVSVVEVDCTVETKGVQHLAELLRELGHAGIECTAGTQPRILPTAG